MIFNRDKVNRMEKRIEDLEESLEGSGYKRSE